MRFLPFLILTCSLFVSCSDGEKTPDVSGIKISISTDRFEQHLFDSTTNNLMTYILQLQKNNTTAAAMIFELIWMKLQYFGMCTICLRRQ